MRLVESAGGIVIDDEGKVLLCHPTGTRWTNWRLPKGVIGHDEDHRKAALREVLEETGYRCTIKRKIVVEIRYRSRDELGSMEKKLTLYWMKPQRKVQEPDWENDKFRWVGREKIEEYAAKTELPAILEALRLWSEAQEKSAHGRTKRGVRTKTVKTRLRP